MKRLMMLCTIGALLLSGCAGYMVRVQPDGNWSVYGITILKETEIPGITVSNSTYSVKLEGYKSSSNAAKELLQKGIDKL